MMEVRWFWSPPELLPQKEDRAKCLLREVFESDRVDEIPVVRREGGREGGRESVFWSPLELLPKKEDRAKCLLRVIV